MPRGKRNPKARTVILALGACSVPSFIDDNMSVKEGFEALLAADDTDSLEWTKSVLGLEGNDDKAYRAAVRAMRNAFPQLDKDQAEGFVSDNEDALVVQTTITWKDVEAALHKRAIKRSIKERVEQDAANAKLDKELKRQAA